MAVKRKYRLNLRNYGNLPAIMLSQYDEGYALEFEIRDGTDAASDLSAYTVTLKGTRADTLAYSFAGTVSTNVLTFIIDTTMTACAGRGTAEIAIKDTANDVLFATFNMPVFVERAAVPEGSIDADVERAQEIAEQVQEIVDNAAAAVSGEAEKWATGQINGTDVPSTDPTYENNAKYYAEQAETAAASIGIDATLTQADKAADAKKTGDEIDELKEDLSNLKQDVNLQSLWEVGGLGSNGESYNPRDTSIRTKSYLIIDEYDAFVTTSSFSTGYICLYTEAYAFIVRKAIVSSTTYTVASLLASYPTAKNVRIEVGNVSGDVSHYNYVSLMALPCSPQNIALIKGNIAQKQNKKCSNLIGNVKGRLYPVENVTTGTVLTFSTSDGNPIGLNPEQTNIGFYDSNKEYINYCGFPQNNASRTITLGDSAADAKYIAIIGSAPRVPIMINYGSTVFPYEEYFEPAPILTEKTNEIEERLEQLSVTATIKDLLSQSKYVYSPTDSGVGTEKTLTLLHFSDVHGNRAGMDYAMSVYNKYASSIDDMLHTGDIVTANLSDGITNWINSGCATSVLSVIGNHDTEENLVLQAAGKDNVYNTIFAPYISNWGVTQPEGVDDSTSDDYHALYYYKDYDEAKVRLIVCDTNFWDSAQKTWLTNTLAGAKTLEYAVVLACHNVKQLTELTSANFSSYNGDGITENTNAYANQPNDWLSPVKDFMDNGGHFVCILAGHNHSGHMGYMTYYPDIFVYVAQKSSMNRVSGTARISGEINQNTVSIVTINPKEKLFKLFSIGAEVDGHMRQRHVFCYNYDTKTIISQW